MTSREQLIALDRDSLEQQVIHLEQKLESAQFERDQERSRAEKAEAACRLSVEALSRILSQWSRIDLDQLHSISPGKAVAEVSASEILACAKALTSLKESQ